METCSRIAYSLVCPASDARIAPASACAPTPKMIGLFELYMRQPEVMARDLTPRQAEFLIEAYVGTERGPGLSACLREGSAINVFEFLTGWRRVRNERGSGSNRPELALIKYAGRMGRSSFGEGRYVVTRLGARVAACLVSHIKSRPVTRLEEAS